MMRPYTITVINLHGILLPPGAIYMGRPTRQYVGSPLANPNHMKIESDRPRVLASYNVWLPAELAKPRSPARLEFNRLVTMARYQDLVLACWCSPLGCHVDFVAELIEKELASHAESDE